jgi:hypothetical protein
MFPAEKASYFSSTFLLTQELAMFYLHEQREGLLNMRQIIPGKLMIKLKGKSRDNIYWNVPHSQACLRCYDCYRQRLIPCILPLIKQRWNGINEWNESTAELKDKRHLCWNSSRANFTPALLRTLCKQNNPKLWMRRHYSMRTET